MKNGTQHKRVLNSVIDRLRHKPSLSKAAPLRIHTPRKQNKVIAAHVKSTHAYYVHLRTNNLPSFVIVKTYTIACMHAYIVHVRTVFTPHVNKHAT